MASQSRKRKLPDLGLQRRVRARADPEPEIEDFTDDSDEGSEMSDNAEEASGTEDPGSDSEAEDESGASSDNEDEAPQVDISSVSLGALVRAQASMSSSGRRKKGRAEDEEASSKAEGPQKGSSRHDRSSASFASRAAKAGSRSSKHAPTEMSSKRPVSRWREAIAVPKIAARDPRFDPVTGPAPDEAKMRKNYAFLDEYRDDEMKQLKVLLKQDGKGKGPGKKGGAVTLAPEERAELLRSLRSMESRKKADTRKAQEREVLAEHRRREKELVLQGKQPFYLKKAEQKKRLLMDQFAGMKKREVDKAMERKRKKMAGKEKKELPFARRGAEAR